MQSISIYISLSLYIYFTFGIGTEFVQSVSTPVMEPSFTGQVLLARFFSATDHLKQQCTLRLQSRQIAKSCTYVMEIFGKSNLLRCKVGLETIHASFTQWSTSIAVALYCDSNQKQYIYIYRIHNTEWLMPVNMPNKP